MGEAVIEGAGHPGDAAGVEEFPHPIDHNRPPSLAEEAVAAMRLALVGFQKRKEDFLRAAEKAVIRDRASAGDVADLIGLANDVGALIETERKKVSEPYSTAATAVIAVARNFWEPVVTAMNQALVRLEAFRKAEADRIAAQQREQREEEERLRAAARAQTSRPHLDYRNPEIVSPQPVRAASPKPAPIRGDYGHKFVAAKRIEIEIVDVLQVPLNILNSEKVQAAIKAVARDFAKHDRNIPGLSITDAEHGQIRS